MEVNIDKIKCFVLDLDGTVYIEGTPIGDMKNTLAKIRESGRSIVYLTNNSSKTAADYIARLSAAQIFQDGDRVYTSGDAATAYLNTHHAGKRVYALATKSLEAELKAGGVNLVDVDPEILLLAYDTELTYAKLCKAALALKRGALYIATHPDINCPAKEVDLPDVGSFISLLDASTGRKPDLIIGKPNTIMGDGLKALTGLNKSELLMVGDRLYTDIKFGVNNGFKSLLVLSGETTEKTYRESDIKADIVLPSLNDIVKYL